MIRITDHGRNLYIWNQKEMKSLSDEQLLRLARTGLVDSFDIIVERYGNLLMNYVFYSIFDLDQSQNIVQETFIRLYRKFTSITGGDIVSTRLYSIASRLITQNLRWKNNSVISESVKYNVGQNSCEWTFRQALFSLDAKLREAIILHDINGMSYDEIAQLLQKPASKVRLYIYRARKNLQDYLKTELIDQPLVYHFSGL